ncbi:MAG: hypothetical protein ABSB81_05880 [Halobacteriota archaeon]|jgi:hypothetical protein
MILNEPSFEALLQKLQDYAGSFQEIGQEPLTWLIQARKLKIAADIILTQIKKDDVLLERIHASELSSEGTIYRLDAVYMYLAGMALENLLKGILVIRHPQLVAEDSIGPRLHQHFVDDYARELDLKLEPAQKELLGRIRLYIEWKGRYQIPKKSNGYDPQLKAENTPWVPTRFGYYSVNSDTDLCFKKDPVLVDRMYDQFQQLLDQESSRAYDIERRAVNRPIAALFESFRL